jgi:hypothetical protein
MLPTEAIATPGISVTIRILHLHTPEFRIESSLFG